MTPAIPSETPASAEPALVERLVAQFGASWVDASNVDDWTNGPGDRVLFFGGDPIRFPEVLDVAVVLPELQRHFDRRDQRFAIGVVRRAGEDAIAARYAAQRRPSIVFVRGGAYVGAIAGMLDWDDYVRRLSTLLDAAPTRVPGVGIPVVASGAGGGCH